MRNRTSFNTTDISDVEVVVRGDIPAEARAEAETKIAALARFSHTPILHARIKLSYAADPAVSRPAIAQVNLDVNGKLVRVQVAARTVSEAIDLVQDRVRLQLEKLSRYWPVRRETGAEAGPHEWRHAYEPAHRPPYFPLPREQREVVRHKAFELAWASPDEAAFDMDLMDYDFHLFTDVETGDDAVVYRAGPTGYRIAYRNGQPPLAPTLAAGPVTVSPVPAARLSLTEAKDRLDESGLPFIFHVGGSEGRAQVLYRRYDGHYGLITPAA